MEKKSRPYSLTQNNPIPGISYRQIMSSLSQKTQDNSALPCQPLEQTEEPRSFPPAADAEGKSPVINGRKSYTRLHATSVDVGFSLSMSPMRSWPHIIAAEPSMLH